jgi:flagellar motor switch/type III secretory pathway protein FliN
MGENGSFEYPHGIKDIMDKALQVFLESSPIAERVHITPQVILRRTEKKVADLRAQLEGRTVRLEDLGEEVCELEIGGQMLARGRLVRKQGKCWFRLTEVLR